MGVSLSAYRARIGLFLGNRRSSMKDLNCLVLSFGLSWLKLPLVCLALLLVASGIEPNPGPTIQCKFCFCSFSKVNNYFSHLSMHLSVRNFRAPCFYPECHGRLKTVAALKVHVSINHAREVQPAAAAMLAQGNFKCQLQTCQVVISSKKELVKHMVKHLDDGHSLSCPYNCNRDKSFSSKTQFKTHISLKHRFVGLPDDKTSDLENFGEQCDNPEQALQIDPGPTTPSASSDLCFENLDFEDNEDIEDSESDPYPYSAVKGEVARFYLRLEGSLLLPSSSVQIINEEVALLSKLSHHSLKRALDKELTAAGLDNAQRQTIIGKTFKMDPVFNIHHKGEDIEPMTSIHLRKQYIKKHFPYAESREVDLGLDAVGKKRVAHYVSIRDTLDAFLRDETVKREVKKSFDRVQSEEGVLADFTDGAVFKSHSSTHVNGKCIQLLLFQDAFEFSPFGPAKGLYKSVGFYYVLGNLSAEYRSKVDMIQLAYMIREVDLKALDLEYLKGEDHYKKALEPLISEIVDLRENGIDIDGEQVPVCLLYCLGDNLGSHQAGSYVQSFSLVEFFCRYCPIPRAKFLSQPHIVENYRTPEDYDSSCALAKAKWEAVRDTAIKTEQKKVEKLKAEALANNEPLPPSRPLPVSNHALKKLKAINFRGVKPLPSPFNAIPGVHAASSLFPPCLAHDIMSGLMNDVLSKILEYFVVTKEWFTLEVLNRRIKSFKYKDTDAADSPNSLKNFDGLHGHAVENWNLLRLLPFLIGDLIQDREDRMWKLYLKLKAITEFVCAPKISTNQVSYLQILIQDYLSDVKELLPSCLTPKHHYLAHYPGLILLFGPLMRLFTLRFESKHVFFKTAGKNCKCFKNITKTLVNKYLYRFAYDHSNEILPPDVSYAPSLSERFFPSALPPDQSEIFQGYPSTGVVSLKKVQVKGVNYALGLWVILDKEESVDLRVGCIKTILCHPNNDVVFLLHEAIGRNSFQGYYEIIRNPDEERHSLRNIRDLPSFCALPAYNIGGTDCLSLKYSELFM